uniref:Secreted protein n=2 Tax=Parascaris univalens TaxID=6257 RepID=A0A915AS77_PARUN
MRKEQLKRRPQGKPRLKVTRAMLVLGVYGSEADKLDLRDWVFALNGKTITKRKRYYKIIKEQLQLNIPYTLKYTIYRTLRTKLIENGISTTYSTSVRSAKWLRISHRLYGDVSRLIVRSQYQSL